VKPALALVVLAGVALSATAARAGRPEATLGEPIPESAVIASISDPDPGGGRPWGVRRFTTTKGFTCSQTGRLEEGKLGTVDDQGVFAELPLRPDACAGPADPNRPPGTYGWGLRTTNVGADGCSLGDERPPGGRRPPRCTARQIRTVLNGHFGARLKRVETANADWSNRRPVAVSPDGEYVVVVRGLINEATQPRMRLYFEGGCDEATRKGLLEEFYRAHVSGCEVVVPLDEPRPQRESAASRRARKHPSAPRPVRVRPSVAGPGRRIFVRFKTPITVGPADAYRYKLSGPGAASCRERLPADGSLSSNYVTMVRGKWAELILPLGGKSKPWCRGTYTVSVHFVSRGKTYSPFGRATFRIR
jgi:hypothetical protein